MSAWQMAVVLVVSCAAAFLLGWAFKAQQEQRRSAKARELRRISGARAMPARPGTHVSVVRKASLDRNTHISTVGESNVADKRR